MKKLTVVLLVFLTIFIFTACKNCKVQNTESTEPIQTQDYNEERTEAEKDNEAATENTVKSIIVKIGEKSFHAQLYDNETAQAFADMLPITLDMEELHGNEKYCYMNSVLPTDSLNVGKINSGDIMLYGNNCIVLFYDSFTTQYSYTKIGKIKNPSDFADTVGSSSVTIEFEKEN